MWLRMYCWPCLLRPSSPALEGSGKSHYIKLVRIGRGLWPEAGWGKMLGVQSLLVFLPPPPPKGSWSTPLENTDSVSSLILIPSTNLIKCLLCARHGSGDASKSYNLPIATLGIESTSLDLDPVFSSTPHCLPEYPAYCRRLRLWNSFPSFDCSSYGFLLLLIMCVA